MTVSCNDPQRFKNEMEFQKDLSSNLKMYILPLSRFAQAQQQIFLGEKPGNAERDYVLQGAATDRHRPVSGACCRNV
jgi:hypothetical protein